MFGQPLYEFRGRLPSNVYRGIVKPTREPEIFQASLRQAVAAARRDAYERGEILGEGANTPLEQLRRIDPMALAADRKSLEAYPGIRIVSIYDPTSRRVVEIPKPDFLELLHALKGDPLEAARFGYQGQGLGLQTALNPEWKEKFLERDAGRERFPLVWLKAHEDVIPGPEVFLLEEVYR